MVHRPVRSLTSRPLYSDSSVMRTARFTSKGPSGESHGRHQVPPGIPAFRRLSDRPAPRQEKTSTGRPSTTSTCGTDRKSTRLNSSHQIISYAVFCLKKKKQHTIDLVLYTQKNRNTNHA